MAKPEELKTCELCGATIYPEHLKKGMADFLAGKLLCPHCLQEKKLIAAVNPANLYREERSAAEPADEPIALVLDEGEDLGGGAVQSFGGAPASSAGTTVGVPAMDREYRRPLLKGSPNATRCRTFHCKLNDASFSHLNATINEWVDANDDIEIKFATSCIGTIEAKSSQDLHLIVTVFY